MLLTVRKPAGSLKMDEPDAVNPNRPEEERTVPAMVQPQVLPFERVWGSEALTVTVVKRDELRASMRAVGELDLCGAPILQAALAAQLRAGRRFLRLDLSELSFIDSCGIRVLQRMHAAALTERGTLILVGPTARTRRVLDLVGLDRAMFLVDAFVEDGLRASVG